MTRDDLFKINAGIVKGLATAIAKNCPKAFTCIISNPVNSTVPICAEVFKTYGCYNPKKLFGVTTLDVVRANTFVSECKGLDVTKTNITVIGGHSGTTIIPLLSQIPGVTFTESQIKSLTQHIQFGGDEVVKAKNGKGSATLSMAYAGARFVDKLLQAIVLNKTVTACSYVESPIAKADGIRFFSSALKIDRNGVQEYIPLGKLSEFEQNLYNECIPQLKTNIEKGVNFVAQSKL
jgi:malate dehydrogenase